VALLALVLLSCQTSTSTKVSPRDISNNCEAFTEGCNNFNIYKRNKNWSEFIVVTGDTGKLSLDTMYKQYSLPHDSAKLSVWYDYYAVNKDSAITSCFNYCLSAVCVQPMPERWTAISGRADIKKSLTDTTSAIPT
jgi:hypothetical protein